MATLCSALLVNRLWWSSTTDSAGTQLTVPQVAHSLDLINNFGGWDKVQAMLKTVKGIADKHSEYNWEGVCLSVASYGHVGGTSTNKSE